MPTVSPAGIGRVVFSLVWAFTGMLLLGALDQAAQTSGSGDAGPLVLGATLSFVFSCLLARRIVDARATRGVAFGSAVFVGFAVPCVVRMADGPLLSGSEAVTQPAIYSLGAAAAIGALAFLAIIAAQVLLSRHAAVARPARERLASDRLVQGVAGLAAVCAVAVVLARVVMPSATTIGADPKERARATVPDLGATTEDELSVLDSDTARIAVVRTHPPPLRIGRLTVDLRDDQGPRDVPNVSVGGDETLTLSSHGGVVWQLNYHVTGAQPVVLTQFVRGRGGDPQALVFSDIRGRMAPSNGVMALTVVTGLAAVAAAFLAERRRRRALLTVSGRDAIVRPDGSIESAGEVFELSRPRHLHPGPIILLGADDAIDPYRGARTAADAIPGTIEWHATHASEEAADLRSLVVVSCALALTPILAAAVIGQLGW